MYDIVYLSKNEKAYYVMSDLMVFTKPEFGDIRTLTRNGEPYFVGKDVALALGYVKPTDAVRNHVDDEDKGVSKIKTPSGDQDMVIINESGLYALIMGSKLPAAKQFKRWVTSEVLPSIRKTGGYNADRVPTPAETLEALKELRKFKGTPHEAVAVSLLRQGGFDVPDTVVGPPVSQACSLDDAVADFLDWLLPQIQHWSLVPFKELYALFDVYQRQAGVRIDCGRNELVSACERVMPRQGWAVPERAPGGKCRQVRSNHRMCGDEPVMRLIAVRKIPGLVRGIYKI